MRIAIIGYGGMANNHRKYIIKRLNDSDYPEKLEIAGVYDISEERNEVAREHGLKCYSSAEELLSDKSVGLVLIATPNDLHLPYVKAAISHGKNVLVEKPAGLNRAEVDEMYEVARKAGLVFTPHQNRRWDDDYLSVVKVAHSGKIGKVYRVESRVMGSNGIPGQWRRIKAQGGGMMLDWGVHLIDQALLFDPTPVTSIDCVYSFRAGENVDDGFFLTLTFESGLEYRIEVDTNSFIELPRWQVYGEDGTATVTAWRKNVVAGSVVSVVDRVDEKLESVVAGNGFTKTMAARRAETVATEPLEIVPGDKNAFYVNMMDAILKGVPTTVTKEQEDRIFTVMELAEKSALTRTVIKGKF